MIYSEPGKLDSVVLFKQTIETSAGNLKSNDTAMDRRRYDEDSS